MLKEQRGFKKGDRLLIRAKSGYQESPDIWVTAHDDGCMVTEGLEVCSAENLTNAEQYGFVQRGFIGLTYPPLLYFLNTQIKAIDSI